MYCFGGEWWGIVREWEWVWVWIWRRGFRREGLLRGGWRGRERGGGGGVGWDWDGIGIGIGGLVGVEFQLYSVWYGMIW